MDGPLGPNTLPIDFTYPDEGLAEAYNVLGVGIDLNQPDMPNPFPRLEPAGDLADRIRKHYDQGRPVGLSGQDEGGKEPA